MKPDGCVGQCKHNAPVKKRKQRETKKFAKTVIEQHKPKNNIDTQARWLGSQYEHND